MPTFGESAIDLSRGLFVLELFLPALVIIGVIAWGERRRAPRVRRFRCCR